MQFHKIYIRKLGVAEPLRLKIIGIPKKTWTVQPAVYRELTYTVNIGIKFLEKIGAALKFKKGNTLIIGDDHTPTWTMMIKILKIVEMTVTMVKMMKALL